MEEKMKNNRIEIIIIVLSLFLWTIFITYIFHITSRDEKMIKQVYSIINQVKGNEKTEINSIYELQDMEAMGIKIPKSPYGTEYSAKSYIKNFNGTYYASFDDGKHKVSGNIDELEFSKIGFFNKKSEYKFTVEESKALIKKELEKKYGEKFEIISLQAQSGILGYEGNSGKAYSLRSGEEKSFDVYISKHRQVTDTYYDILIENE